VDRVRFAEALVSIVADQEALVDLPERLCTACLEALPVDGMGLSLMTTEPGARALLGASDAVGVRIEDAEFELGEGPCVSAFTDAQPVLVPDLRSTESESRWPMFTREIASTAARGLFAFPLQVGVIGIGALDCYRGRAGPLNEVAEALVVVDAVTIALLNYQSRAPNHEADLFDLSWRTHAVVHQATGALSAQFGVDTAEALARLRAYAFRASRPVHTVAREILDRTLDLTSEEE
jgi:hypothetical protein